MLDATMSGMGRGAGNCAMDALLGFLKNPKYKIDPVLKFIQDEMVKLKNEGLVWGYDVPYLITGLLNVHPRSAIDCIKQERTDYANFFQEIWDKEA